MIFQLGKNELLSVHGQTTVDSLLSSFNELQHLMQLLQTIHIINIM
jgi:hypothetical protein